MGFSESNNLARAICGLPPSTRRNVPTYTTPRCPKYLHRFDYFIEDVELVCHVEFEPACKGSRGDYGLQMEPDYGAQATLCAAYVRDIDVYELLSDDQRADIEEAFLTQDSDEGDFAPDETSFG